MTFRRTRQARLIAFAALCFSAALTAAARSPQASPAAAPSQTRTPAATTALPARLTDQQFWSIITSASEDSGTFHSENLVSNEARFQSILPKLMDMTLAGRAYVGVGSEQNFTYIAALKPTVAFIVDLRRGNLDLHLIYKALFEMSADRAEFVSKLFARPRPAGLTATSSTDEIFAAFERSAPSEALFKENLDTITAWLTTKHGFDLSDGDREGMHFVYRSWFDGGPDLRYQLTTGSGPGGGGRGNPGGRGRGAPGGLGGGGSPTYADLMTSHDGTGKNWSYLASDANFKVLKDLETRNMFIPVVGNFAGPKALRAVATWLSQHAQTVSAFYLSNVEQYLRQDGIWAPFCANAAALPRDARSVFIRSVRGGGGFDLDVMSMTPEVGTCTGR